MNTKLILKYLTDLSGNKNREWYCTHISSQGKLPIPVGYYLMIKPGNQSFLGGLFADMFKDATKMVRDYIVENGKDLEAIIKVHEFQKYFTLRGTALKNVPAGYDKSHPQAE